MTKADQQAHQGVRLLPGVVEVTPALVAAENSCATLQTMITSLDTVANQGADSGFYMLSAVQAHENLHITQYRGDLAPHYATLKTAVEALSVPAAGVADAAAAKAAIKALQAYTAAMATFCESPPKPCSQVRPSPSRGRLNSISGSPMETRAGEVDMTLQVSHGAFSRSTPITQLR